MEEHDISGHVWFSDKLEFARDWIFLRLIHEYFLYIQVGERRTRHQTMWSTSVTVPSISFLNTTTTVTGIDIERRSAWTQPSILSDVMGLGHIWKIRCINTQDADICGHLCSHLLGPHVMVHVKMCNSFWLGQASSFGQLPDDECTGLADSLLEAFKESARFCEDCWWFLDHAECKWLTTTVGNPSYYPPIILSTIYIEIVVFPRASEELRDLDMGCLCFTFSRSISMATLLYVFFALFCCSTFVE